MRKLIPLAILAILAGCDRPEPTPTPEAIHPLPGLSEEYQALEEVFAVEAKTPLRKLTVSAPGLRDAIDGLLNDPEEERLETARNAWRAVYQNWNRGFVVLASLALDDPQRLAALLRSDPLPIMPGYVDSLSEWPESGIVHDVTVPLDRDSLLAQQDVTAEGEASVGFQVLQFLLFGEPDQPRTVAELTATEASEDNAEAAEAGDEAGLPSNRRRSYLKTTAELLADDLTLLAEPTQINGQDLIRALSQALALANERLGTLNQLEGQTDPAGGDFLAGESREIALENLKQALAFWYSGEGQPVLLAVYHGLAPEFALALEQKLEQDPEDIEGISLLLSGRPQVLR